MVCDDQTTKKGMVDKSKVTLDARWGVNTRGVPEYDIMKDQREYVLTAWNTLKINLQVQKLPKD